MYEHVRCMFLYQGAFPWCRTEEDVGIRYQSSVFCRDQLELGMRTFFLLLTGVFLAAVFFSNSVVSQKANSFHWKVPAVLKSSFESGSEVQPVISSKNGAFHSYWCNLPQISGHVSQTLWIYSVWDLKEICKDIKWKQACSFCHHLNLFI